MNLGSSLNGTVSLSSSGVLISGTLTSGWLKVKLLTKNLKAMVKGMTTKHFKTVHVIASGKQIGHKKQAATVSASGMPLSLRRATR